MLIAARIIEIYAFIIFERVLMSWIPMFTQRPLNYSNPLIKFLMDITEPVLAPIRRVATIGMIDLSPIIALVVLSIVSGILEDAARGG